MILAKPGNLSNELRDEVYVAIDHVQKEAQLGAVPDLLRCDASLRFQDWPMLKTCTDRLAMVAPNDAKTVSFQWALAVHDHDKVQAEALVDRARTLRMDPAGIQKMEAANRAMSRTTLVRFLFVMAVLALLGGAWWLGAKKMVARRNANA